ncbi:MAG: MBL fold metallo-hydrolase [Candidatus Bathyarchaeota archaeon]|nr:MAG: MBL fold metallo-hydrolase [Candidatus Bathyarchaeota archaeon]
MVEQQDRSGLIKEFFALPLKKKEIAFTYLGYSGIILRVEDRAVAVDIGFGLQKVDMNVFSKLDLLLFTHSHSDHYNRARTRGILEKSDVHIVAQHQVAEDLKDRAPPNRLTSATPKKPIGAGGFEIAAVVGIHPRPISIFRIKKDKFTVFHGGDSGYAPVKEYPAEIAFLPTGSPSPSCSPESALRFARDLKPRIAVAMHGNSAQMNKFKNLVEKEMPNTTIIIPKKYQVETLTL